MMNKTMTAENFITFNWGHPKNDILLKYKRVSDIILDGYVLVFDSNKHTINFRFEIRDSQIQAPAEVEVEVRKLFPDSIGGTNKLVRILHTGRLERVKNTIISIVDEHTKDLNKYWETKDMNVLDVMIDKIREEVLFFSSKYAVFNAENWIDNVTIANLKEELNNSANSYEYDYIVDRFVREYAIDNNTILIGLYPLIKKFMDF